MGRLIKLTSAFLLILALCVSVVMMLFNLIANPARLQPLIIEQVKRYSGYQLEVNSGASWAFLPFLGIQFGNVQLNDNVVFKQPVRVDIDDALIAVKFIPLLEGRVESNKIFIKNMTLHSTNNELGQPYNLLRIKNVNLYFSHYWLKKMVPVKMTFDFVVSNSVITGHASLSGDLVMNLRKRVYVLRRSKLHIQFAQMYKKIDFATDDDLVIDLRKKTVRWQSVMPAKAGIQAVSFRAT